MVFDATIPDHFALAAAMAFLEKRYGECDAVLPQAVRAELQRAVSRLPRLHDALRAPWLKNYANLSLAEVQEIEIMREERFGEGDPLRGLGECVALFLAQKLASRAGVEDRVARRMAKDMRVRSFTAIQVLQALYRHCGATKGELWNLYSILLTGTGARGTKLTSLAVMGRTKFEKYLSNRDETYA